MQAVPSCPFSPRVYTYVGTWSFPNFREMIAMVNNFHAASQSREGKSNRHRDDNGNDGVFVIPVPPQTQIPHVCLLNSVDRAHMRPTSISELGGNKIMGRPGAVIAFVIFILIVIIVAILLVFWLIRAAVKAYQLREDTRADEMRRSMEQQVLQRRGNHQKPERKVSAAATTYQGSTRAGTTYYQPLYPSPSSSKHQFYHQQMAQHPNNHGAKPMY
eukprot:Selendium_serpulae@DN6433_c0_g1_i3.p1